MSTRTVCDICGAVTDPAYMKDSHEYRYHRIRVSILKESIDGHHKPCACRMENFDLCARCYEKMNEAARRALEE